MCRRPKCQVVGAARGVGAPGAALDTTDLVGELVWPGGLAVLVLTQSTWLLSDGQDIKLVIYAPSGADNAERARDCLQADLAMRGDR